METAYILVGLAYGDEGKGTMTDFLCRHTGASLVVRYNGGPQAAHNVMTRDGKHHTFSQFGSGTLAGARTHISRFMLVDPFDMSREAEVLEENFDINPFALLTVDPRAVVITPYHKWANRLREKLRGDACHSSVGKGVGEARQDQLEGLAIGFGELRDPKIVDTLRLIQKKKLEDLVEGSHTEEFQNIFGIRPAEVADFYKRFTEGIWTTTLANLIELKQTSDTVIFEGAQGILLDEEHGYAPYNSWTRCTTANAEEILKECGFDKEIIRVGITRTYATRHGRGPFVTEDKQMAPSSAEHNQYHQYMKGFRVGHLDIMALRQAMHCNNGLDALAVTHADCPPSNSVCVGYKFFPFGAIKAGSHLTQAEILTHHVQPVYIEVEPGAIPQFIEHELRVPLDYVSFGPRSNQKTVRQSVAVGV